LCTVSSSIPIQNNRTYISSRVPPSWFFIRHGSSRYIFWFQTNYWSICINHTSQLFIKYLVHIIGFCFFFLGGLIFFLQRILSSLFTLSVFLCSLTSKWTGPICLGSQNCQLLSAESLGRSTKLCAIISVTKCLSSQESHMTRNPFGHVSVS